MADRTTDQYLSPISLALGRIPTGLYVVTTRVGTTPSGFLASFLMQVALQPPALGVAIRADRPPLASIREASWFGVSVLDAQSASLMKPFVRPPVAGATEFDGLAVGTAPGGSPVLEDALAWLECRVVGEHPVADHVVVFGQVESAQLCREGESSVRLRKNGLEY